MESPGRPLLRRLPGWAALGLSALPALARGGALAAAVPGQDHHTCFGEANMEYEGSALAQVPHLETADACCIKCRETPPCRLWMWGPENEGDPENICTMRGADPRAHFIRKVPRKGVVSGVPFRWDQPHTIFCFALMQPSGYERDLIKMQHEKQWGIFACEEYSVISNVSLQLAPGVVTSVINSDMKCDFGGEFGTALNTDLFLQVWQSVINDARFQFNDWTVKADPDCVFFPQRLHVTLAFHPDTYHGAYINNCKYGMHGPLEVLSTAAVFRWARGYQTCQEHFNELCSGPCLWGEDMFMDQCLWKVLKVKRIDDNLLLSEDHCDSKDWKACKNGNVAFHPFKSNQAFTACMEAAEFGALPLLV